MTQPCFKENQLSNINLEFLRECSTPVLRRYLTKKSREEIFDITHYFSDPGSKSLTKMITGRFVWPSRQIWQTRLYFAYLVGNQTKTPIDNVEIPEKRSKHINIDILGHYLVQKIADIVVNVLTDS